MKPVGSPIGSIGARLGGAFALLLLLLLACVGIGVLQLGSLSEAVVQVGHSAQASRRAVTLVAQGQETAAALGRAVMADSVDVIQGNLKLVSTLAADMQSGTKALADLDHADAAALKAVQATEVSFRMAMGKVAESIKSGDTDAARIKLNEKDTLAAGTAYLAALNKLADDKRQHAEEARQAAAEAHAHGRNLLVGFGVLGAVLAALAGAWITRSVTRQIGGEPQAAARVARAVAAGDLATPVHVRAGDEVSVIAAMREMQKSLARVVAEVRGNSESVASASAKIAQGNADLSQRTEEQAGALEQTAATMHQLGATVKDNASNARQANELAKQASGVAQSGGAVVSEVVQMMKAINGSSRRIAEIIGTIDGIAFQTNILALNAAVEAARAGDQGRGFAVVAGEVRSLARRSADAAREIKGLITASVEQVEQGTSLVDKAGVTMSDVVASIRRVSDIVGEISAASTEQADGVARVAQAVAQMDSMTQQNATLVEQSAAAAEGLTAQARSLVDTVAVFTLARETVN